MGDITTNYKQKKKASLTPEGSVIAAQLLIHGTSAPKDMQIGPFVTNHLKTMCSMKSTFSSTRIYKE